MLRLVATCSDLLVQPMVYEDSRGRTGVQDSAFWRLHVRPCSRLQASQKPKGPVEEVPVRLHNPACFCCNLEFSLVLL